jgi:hypothetical protein
VKRRILTAIRRMIARARYFGDHAEAERLETLLIIVRDA